MIISCCELHSVFQGTGLCLNLLLVLLILFVTKPEIGVYKYLQVSSILSASTRVLSISS